MNTEQGISNERHFKSLMTALAQSVSRSMLPLFSKTDLLGIRQMEINLMVCC